jgi:hypothetical protein
MTAGPDGEGPVEAVNEAAQGDRDVATPTYTYDLAAKEEPSLPTEKLVSIDRKFQQRILGRQEWVRTVLAAGAFLSLVGVLAFLLGAVYSDVSPDNIEQIATVVVTPLTGIVGTIIGFYFAERKLG